MRSEPAKRHRFVRWVLKPEGRGTEAPPTFRRHSLDPQAFGMWEGSQRPDLVLKSPGVH